MHGLCNQINHTCEIQQTMSIQRTYKERHLTILRKGFQSEVHLQKVIPGQLDLAPSHQEETA